MIIKKEKSEIQSFLVDAANYKGDCEAVYFPETVEEIVAIVKEANKKKQRITVAGNGTGLTGARVPESGIVISMSNFNRILEINNKEKYAVVQPGVMLSDFKKVLNDENLIYPPDPTEQNCFIGATIATNSSGAKSFKYGATRNFVLELQIVLPSGGLTTIQRNKIYSEGLTAKLPLNSGDEIIVPLPNYTMPDTKHAAGYFSKSNMDLIDLFIGSEGTLGIITEAKVKLLEKPENIISGVLFFENKIEALNFVDEVREESVNNRNKKNGSHINAIGIEYFDYFSLQFLKEDYPKIKDNHNAAIWFEQDISSETEEAITEKWMQLITKYNADIDNSWFAVSAKEREEFKNFRHAVSAKVSEYISKVGLKKVGTDTAVPVHKFREFYSEMEKRVEAEGLKYICYGHIGDCHLHLNMLPKNNIEFSKAKELYRGFCKLAVSFGGTISAEHGIGKMKREYLLDMFGEIGVSEMAKTKKAVDPNLILGIGNIFSESFLYEK